MQSTRTCSFDGCDKPHKARGLCDGHYIQQHKGQELRPLRSQITLEQRFWQKVTKTPGCWEWTAAMTSDGYGQIKADGWMRYAHRFSWELVNGPISEGLVIDHRCGNPSCVNPDHLRATTHSQNLQHRTGNQRNNTSGARGVTWRKDKNAWHAYTNLNGRRYHGGFHATLEAADRAARALRKELHTHDDHEKWLNTEETS